MSTPPRLDEPTACSSEMIYLPINSNGYILEYSNTLIVSEELFICPLTVSTLRHIKQQPDPEREDNAASHVAGDPLATR